MSQIYKYSWTELKILKQNWEKIAKEYNGKSESIKTKFTGNHSDPYIERFKLSIPFNDSLIEFQTSELKPLEVRYPFKHPLEYEFEIYTEDYIDKIRKFFGFKEIEIGDAKFDKKFIIKAKDKNFVKNILTSELKIFLLKNIILNFQLKAEKGNSVIKMQLYINELVYSQIYQLIDIVKSTILNIQNWNDIKQIA